MKCDVCGAAVENGVCTNCGKIFAVNPALKPVKGITACKVCGAQIAKSAKRCPSCGAKVKKPLFKKWWFWAVLALLVLLFALPDGDSKKEITADAGENDTVNSTSESTALSGNKKAVSGTEKYAETKTSIDEQVILDHDNIVITAVEYVTDSFWGDGIKLLVENNGTKTVGIGCDALIVNNYMINDLFSTTVAAGKKDYETVYLLSSEMNAAGIENVGQIELYLHLYDADTYLTTYNADKAVIKTSDYDKMDTIPNDLGIELYNADGVRIIGKYVDENSIWGTSVLLYMENNTGKNITVECEDLSVNGFMVTSWLYSTIYNGKMAIDDIDLSSSDLEENNIDSVENIELVFRIINADTYSTIRETDPIKFSVK